MRRTIALVIDSLGTDYHESVQQAAERVTRELDLNLITFIGRRLGDASPSELAQNFVYDLMGTARIDAVLVTSCVGNFISPEALAAHCERYRPLPLCSVGITLPGVPSVVADNRAGVRLMVEHLITAHGCRRLAFIGGPAASAEARDRYDGFLDAHRLHGLTPEPALLATGDFMPATARAAMEAMLDAAPLPDAVVAANDLMALGALDVLRERGLRVPQQTVVAGFDDFPTAKFASPSLTTVRQPMGAVVETALRLLLTQLDGGAVSPVTTTDVELVLRQSCGCAYDVMKGSAVAAPRANDGSPAQRVTAQGEALTTALLASVRFPREALGGWTARLLRSFVSELEGQRGGFLGELETLLDEALHAGLPLDELLTAVGVLRGEAQALLGTLPGLENLWHAATTLVGVALAREQGRARLDLRFVAEMVSKGLQRVSTALSHEALCETLFEFLPAARVMNAAISLFSESRLGPELRHMFALKDGRPAQVSAAAFPAQELAPASLFSGEERSSYILMPLTFGEQRLGVMLLSSGSLWQVYMMLRDQVSGSLIGASLHQAIVRETEARERAERAETEREVRIAQQIQTAIVPTAPKPTGFEVAGSLVPAVEVGGDYFDVLSRGTSCWIGIGDVTGHGLMAGVIMMMMQSMIAALIERDANASPARVLSDMNAVLFDNVRDRLRRDDHATLCLLRLDADGQVTHAGAHEDILVYRARTRRCERLTTTGVWVGAVREVSRLMVDQRFQLEPGDVVILHTDGVTEAMDARNERFGLDRVVEVVERRHGVAVAEICEALVEAARHFSTLQRDDITVVVARYAPDR